MVEVAFSELPNLPVDTLLMSLTNIVEEMAGLSEEIGMVEAQECRAKVEGYLRSEGSDAARTKAGTIQAVEMTSTLYELRSHYTSLNETKWLINRIIDARR